LKNKNLFLEKIFMPLRAKGKEQNKSNPNTCLTLLKCYFLRSLNRGERTKIGLFLTSTLGQRAFRRNKVQNGKRKNINPSSSHSWKKKGRENAS